ncbi:MAG: SGNH/GDSL hydrolase family protein, partial [Verrucomicrobiaceae bacterium]
GTNTDWIEFSGTSATPTVAANPTGDATVKNYDLTKLPKSRRALIRVKSELGRMKVGFMGDSNTAGEGAGLSGSHLYTGAMPRALPALVAKTLRNNGVPASFANFIGFAGGTGDITYDPRLTFVNMNADVNALSGSYLKGQDACSFTFAPGEKFNEFVVRHLQLGGQGTFKVCIDGNTSAPLGTIVVASSPEAMVSTTFQIPGESAVHTVTVFKEGGSGLNFFESIQCYDTTRPKVEVFNMGTCAKTAADYVENDKPWHRMQAMSTFGLDMLFIQFGINEEIQGSTASYKSNMQTIITLAKAAGIEVVLVLHSAHNGGQDQSVVAAAIADLATTNNVAWVDFNAVLGTFAAANAAGDWFDTYHPTAQGYSLQARSAANAILAL